MKKNLLVQLSLLFALTIMIFPNGASAAMGEECEQVIASFDSDGHLIGGPEEEECSGSNFLPILLLGGGIYLGYNLLKDNILEGVSEEAKAEFMNDLAMGKGIRIKKFESGFSIYLLPTPNAQQKSFDHEIGFSNSNSNNSNNILTMDWKF